MNTDERGFLDLLAEQLLGAGVLESGAGSRPDVKSWRGPRSTRPSRSASAWNLTRMTRPLELRNQFCMRPPRLLVLRFSDALSFREVGVYLFLVPQVKRQCAMHLFERQCRVRIDHTLGRHPLAKQIHERVKRDSRPPDLVLAFDPPNVFYRHRLPRNLWSHGEATWRKRTPGINDPARGHRRALSRRRVVPTKPWLGSRLLVPCLPPCASRDGCGRLVSSPTPRLARHPWSYSLFSYQGKTWRSDCATPAWNNEMPAIPAAPACRHCAVFSAVTPPSASTGTFTAAAASRKRSRPSGAPYAAFDGVKNTGPKTAKSAPSLSARRTSSAEWQDTPIRKPGGTIPRQTPGAIESAGKCTPCAPQASATSVRSFTRMAVPCGFGRRNARLTSSTSSHAVRSFSRIWMRSTPAASARAIAPSSASHPPSGRRSVM